MCDVSTCLYQLQHKVECISVVNLPIHMLCLLIGCMVHFTLQVEALDGESMEAICGALCFEPWKCLQGCGSVPPVWVLVLE